MKRFSIALCALSVALGAPLSVRNADASDCSCLATPAKGAAFGSVLASSGKVSITGVKGVKSAAPGTHLPAGASLFTGAGSRASVSFGPDCAVQLGGNSALAVEQVGGKLCPKVTELSVTSTASASYGAPLVAGQIAVHAFPIWVTGGFVLLVSASLIFSIADSSTDHGGGPISP